MKSCIATIFLACMLMLNGVSVSAAEAEVAPMDLSQVHCEVIDTVVLEGQIRATGSYDRDIPSGKIMRGDTAFPLGQNEVVTINCTYSPRESDLDIGLIAPNGRFYYIETSGGVFDESIKVDDAGYYYLAIRNNSDDSVNVKGFVYY